MDQKAIIDFGQRVHRIDVGGQVGRRLALAHGQHPAGLQPAQHLAAVDHAAGLAEHVERKPIARVAQGAIPRRVGQFQRTA